MDIKNNKQYQLPEILKKISDKYIIVIDSFVE